MKNFNMQRKDRIIELFEKLISNQAVSKEKEELFQLINSENIDEMVFAWLKDNWDNVKYDQLNISSKAILDKIHDKLEIEESTDLRRKNPTGVRKIILTTMKYAAACILGYVIHLLVIAQTDENLNKDIIPQTVQYNEINVPKGSKSYIVLSDSTKVWLNAGAKLRYPTDFQRNTRKVFLEGEAFFNVSKKGEMPFLVNTTGIDIKVLGTQFNVKAYADDNSIETTLLEGSIEIIGLKSDKEGESNLMLEPGQKLVLLKNENIHQVSDVSSEKQPENENVTESIPVKIKRAQVITLNDTEPEVSWKEDKLIFNKERFGEIKVKLERWYGVNINVKDSEILDYRFTGTFDKETFEQAMFALKQAAKFDYSIKKKNVTVKRN
ncbi:FecR family protein [Mariniphaga sediminis]|uniref:FecR family protein n=2 Tax=Mariniphaga sediminis TaxID=1628158 RepID=A0A399D4R8_9BACT|nr:FecR family protein [Mariniphaga sediminis]